MNRKPQTSASSSTSSRMQQGFSLIELMVAITISLLIMLALVSLYVNLSRTNTEMAKTNSQIENGRFAIQLLQEDIVHAGYWGTYVPQFDDLTWVTVPSDAPTAVPDPCLDYSPGNWTPAYKNNLIGISVQVYDAAPSGCASIVTDKQANTDVLVVRHAETCVPGATNCGADKAGKLYFQSSLYYAANGDAPLQGQLQAGGTTSSTLVSTSSSADDYYKDMAISTIGGTGANQTRTITAYSSSTKVATVSPAWSPATDATTTYTIYPYVLDTTGFNLHKRIYATAADKRRFISNIYYVRNYAVTPGDGIPTLMRSQFDPDDKTLRKHGDPIALIEGIEGFRVELGIDNLSETGSAVNYAQAITWVNPKTKTAPINRGDGIPDSYIRCTTALPCNTAQLSNAVVLKLYVLARNSDTTPSYTDTKTYTLGSTTLGPFGDHYKRHVFSNTVRLKAISGRRETP